MTLDAAEKLLLSERYNELTLQNYRPQKLMEESIPRSTMQEKRL